MKPRAQWLRIHSVLKVLAEDQSSVLSTHIRQLITPCNSSSRESYTFFWSWGKFAFMCTYPYTDRHIYI